MKRSFNHAITFTIVSRKINLGIERAIGRTATELYLESMNQNNIIVSVVLRLQSVSH